MVQNAIILSWGTGVLFAGIGVGFGGLDSFESCCGGAVVGFTHG